MYENLFFDNYNYYTNFKNKDTTLILIKVRGNNKLESHNRAKKEFIKLKNTRVSTTSHRREEASPSIDFCCSDRFDIICRERLFL